MDFDTENSAGKKIADEIRARRQAQGLPPFGQEKRARSNRTLLFVVLFIAGGMGLFFIGMFSLVVNFMNDAVAIAANQNQSGLMEVTVKSGDKDSTSKVAVVTLDGVIGMPSLVGANSSHPSTIAQLKRALDDDGVKAIVLKINSPGGGLTASDLIHNEVMKVVKKNKPIVVWIGDVCASGGYYVAAPADYIISCPTGMVGSIGVIMPRFEIHGLLDKYGIKAEPIMAGESKDIGSMFRPMKPDEKKYFQGLLDHSHNRFIDIVATGRNGKMTREEVVELADGRIFTSDFALKAKLIDEIGYFDSAVKKAKNLGNCIDARVVVYSNPPTLRDMLGVSMESPSVDAEMVLHAIETAATPQIRAQWYGGVSAER